MVNLNAVSSEIPDATKIGVANPIADAKLAEILKEYKDVFPAELPGELPLERTVFHAIPLKEVAVPPPKKMYCLSEPEKREVQKQVDSLLGLVVAHVAVRSSLLPDLMVDCGYALTSGD